jgi:DNA-binding HxlR family transcriptional regulator
VIKGVTHDKRNSQSNRVNRNMYILEYLHTHTKVQYKELNRALVPHTLNARLRELLMYKLIEHHLVRKDTRKEWYEITEKGKRVLQLMRKLQKICTHTL